MKKIAKFLFHPLSLLLLALLLLAVLVVWAGPSIGIGRIHPLDSITRRAVACALLGILWLLAAWMFVRRRRRAARAAADAGTPPAAAPELGFERALAALNDSARQSGRRFWWRGRRHLYERPWYLMLGPPGSGKSTALRQAGLGFGFGTQPGGQSARSTRHHCDWAIAEEAVLIDATGDFSLPPDGAQDIPPTPGAWQQLLSLLKKTRPHQPLNGVLLTLSVPQLLQRDPATRRELAASLRARLHELQAQLGIRPPVYLLITKIDLLAGFQESFGAWDRQEREQVWGMTFTPTRDGGESPVQSFPAEFAALEKRLRDRLLATMQAESDPARRSAIFAFPPQFAGLRGVLGAFLESVFGGGGELEQNALLRGLYFTSAQQDGRRIDRVLDTLARGFGVDEPAAAAAVPTGARSYFLARLLREVVLVERGLVGESRQVAAKVRRRRLLTTTALLLVAATLAAAWSVSYLRNSAYLTLVQGRLPALQKAVAALPADEGTDLSALPRPLDRARAVAEPAGEALESPSVLARLGLWQEPYLRDGADTAYRHLLDQALLPRIERRLQERLRAAGGQDLEQAYDALKYYLVLHQPSHPDAAGLQRWIEQDWQDNLAGALPPAPLASLSRHLARALDLQARPSLPPVDTDLVARVREMLMSHPVEDRVYSRMRHSGVGAATPEFTVVSAAGPHAADVFERASGQPIRHGVPGLFTREGYLREFRGAIEPTVRQLEDERRWVLDLPAAAAESDTAGMVERVRQRYLQDYIQQWDSYLGDVRLARLGDLGSSLQVAGVLAAADSPLPAYLRAVVHQTGLGAAVRAESPLQPVPEAQVDAHFARLQRLTQGNPAPIDEVQRLLNDAYLQLNAVAVAQHNGSAPAPAGSGPGAAASAAAVALQPEPIRSMLQSLGDAGSQHGHQAQRQGLSTDLRPLADFCARAIAGRYPFASGSATDVPLGDFGQFFGAGGLMDEFFQRNLAASVDTGASPWRWRQAGGGNPSADGKALVDFQRAARIREAFFRQGGQKPAFSIDLRLLDRDDALKDLVLEVDGQALHFDSSPAAVAQTLTWPGLRNTAHIVLGGGGSKRIFDGPWALFRFLQHFEIQPSEQPERFTLVLDLDGRQARFEAVSASAIHPLRLRELERFRCPDQL